MAAIRLAMLALLSLGLLLAAEPLALIRAGQPAGGWEFGNGPEFPGAVGTLAIDDGVEPQRRPALALHGDLAKGGNYVQAGVALPAGAELERLSCWLKAPGGRQVSLRLIDGSGQCHQLVLALAGSDGWQRVEVPVQRFFALIAAGQALPGVARYEHWGGAKDGRWHGPARHLFLLAGRDSFGGPAGTVWISGAQAVTATTTQVSEEVRLDEMLREGLVDWRLNLGSEFPGAQGTLTVAEGQGEGGQVALRLQGDFSKGGAYIGADKDLGGLAVESIRMRVKSTVPACGVRLVDATGQCHQRKGVALATDGAWHDLVLKPGEIAGGEHWGGANDGRWHGPAKLLALNIGKTGEILLSDLRAQVQSTGQVAAPAWQEGFEAAGLPAGWQVEGRVAVAAGEAAAGTRALVLERALEAVDAPTRALGAWFPASPGRWLAGGSAATRLVSPDASFCLLVAIEAGDAAGTVLGAREVVAPFATRAWQRFATPVELPAGTAQARFVLTLAKTHGWAAVDALSAAAVTSGGRGDGLVDRIELSSARLGNLFLPEDPVRLVVEVPVRRPLPEARRQVAVTVRDFWGAELGTALSAQLRRTEVRKGRLVYRAEVDCSALPLELGCYYEAHVSVPGGEAAERTGFARLPVAETKALKPGEVPITIRSWDGRIADYVRLADRLGIRQFGLWGRWKDAPPYESELPCGELVRELGGTWLTGTEAAVVEHEGFKRYSEDDLRAGMTAFLHKFAGQGLQALCQGNEPPEDPGKVAEKVRAYKAIYQAVKAFDPAITVIGTSVPPLESFFAAGYQDWLDAYDFHVYESHRDVRRVMRAYRALMEKYHAVKPIHSTELGLNSQGMSRHAVAVEMVKKLTSFFAEGGASASWFGIMYPDRDGVMRGTSGSAHNVFDCQYSLYNPKLDAVMYYHLVNGFAARRLVAERAWADGSEGYLFRDAAGTCLLVLWNDRAAVDVQLPLAGAEDLRLIRVDGGSAALAAAAGGVTLRLSAEPLLLRYRQSSGGLPEQLAAPRLALVGAAAEVVKGGSAELVLAGPGLAPSALRVVAPVGWRAELRADAPDRVQVRVGAPATTAARAGRIQLQRLAGGAMCAELGLELAVRDPVQLTLTPYAARGEAAGGFELVLRNGGVEARTLTWSAAVESAFPLAGGSFRIADPQPAEAALDGAVEGGIALAPGQEHRVRLALRDGDPRTLYRVRAGARDGQGRELAVARYVGGFASAARSRAPLAIDGRLDEPVWAQAPLLALDRPEQVQRYGIDQAPARAWGGPAELSAGLRLAWDERNLYLGVAVRDDVLRAEECDGQLWRMDGLQLLVDPFRQSESKAGKYDYSLGVGSKGPQAFCHLSARADVPGGLVPEIAVAMVRGAAGGDRTYEVAIPWTRLAPFVPRPGADLGLCLIVNDDDGKGRDGFIGWFSGAHAKEVDMVGDVILGDAP